MPIIECRCCQVLPSLSSSPLPANRRKSQPPVFEFTGKRFLFLLETPSESESSAHAMNQAECELWPCQYSISRPSQMRRFCCLQCWISFRGAHCSPRSHSCARAPPINSSPHHTSHAPVPWSSILPFASGCGDGSHLRRSSGKPKQCRYSVDQPEPLVQPERLGKVGASLFAVVDCDLWPAVSLKHNRIWTIR